MADLRIRNVDDEVKRRLRVRAAEHGRSMAAEAREILTDALREPEPPSNPLKYLRERFAALGGVELAIPPRNSRPRR